MPISDTASSPSGSAGEGGLSAAFDKAIGDVGMPDDNFHEAAGEPSPEVVETDEPVDENAPPEPEARPAAKPVKVKAHVREQVDKTAAPAPDAALTAPANWDASRKAAFDKLPTPEAKKLLLDMSKGLEAEYGRKTTEHSNKVKYAEAVDSLVTPEHRRQMAAGGFKSVVEGLAHLIRINDQATSDFPNYARWALGQYAGDAPMADVLRSIFPEAFTGTTQPDGQQPAPRPQVDPQTKQVYDTLQQVMQEVQGLKAGNQQAQIRTADQVIAKFRTEADDAGNPKRPHLAQVEQSMAALLGTPALLGIEDMGERLQRAYDTAVAMDPTLRQTVLDSEVQRRIAEQNKAADLAKAKRARAPINAPPSGPAGKPIKGIDGALRQAGALTGLI